MDSKSLVLPFLVSSSLPIFLSQSSVKKIYDEHTYVRTHSLRISYYPDVHETLPNKKADVINHVPQESIF